jgi:hypothetical protein
MNKKYLHELALLQKRFAKHYREGPLIAVVSDYVHITAEAMAELIRGPNGSCGRVTNRHEDEYPIEFKIETEGVTFLAIMSYDEIHECALREFVPAELLEAYVQHLYHKGARIEPHPRPLSKSKSTIWRGGKKEGKHEQ